MKILLATYWSIPHLGGVWSYMQQLKKSLELHGHEVDLLGFGEDNEIVHIVNKSQQVSKKDLLPFLQAKLSPQLFPHLYENALVEYTEFQRYVYELAASYFGLEDYDIIHTQDVISTTCLNRVRPATTPLVATLHGSVAHEIRYQLQTIHKSPNAHLAKQYYDELERLGATSADVTIVANDWLKQLFVNEFAVPPEDINILHYGYDTEAFIAKKHLPTTISPPDNKKVIVYSGRLVELKGVHFLIQALSKLKKERQDWICWIIGDGEKKEELQQLVSSMQLDNDVYFLGSREDVAALLSKADLYVLPSLIENQPLSLIEAQLSGLPAIISRAGGLPEMVTHYVNGLHVTPGDIDELFEAMQLLLSHPQLAQLFGHNAKNWGLTHWSLENGVRKLLKLYELAIEKKVGGDPIVPISKTEDL